MTTIDNITRDSKFNQFFIDPTANYLVAALVAYVAEKGNLPWGDYFPMVAAGSRLLASVLYYLINKGEEETTASRFLRDYMLPPLVVGGICALYGSFYDFSQLGYISAVTAVFTELLTDVVEMRLRKRFG